MSIPNISFPNSFQTKPNSEEPLSNKAQPKKADLSEGVELLTSENVKNMPYECQPGECAPMFGGTCWPDHD